MENIWNCFFVPLLPDSSHRDSLHCPRPFFSEWGCAVQQEDLQRLFHLSEFRPQRQNFRLTCQSAWMFRIECNPCQIFPNPNPHQIIARELLAGQSIAFRIFHLPCPCQIFVGNPLLCETAIGLMMGQHISDQFQQMTRRSTWTASPYAPNVKSLYNGRVRGSLWFTISAKSTRLGRSPGPS